MNNPFRNPTFTDRNPTFTNYLGKRFTGQLGSYNSEETSYIIVREGYLNSILRRLDSLREEVKRLRPPIKDYKIDAVAWNVDRETSAARKHWIDTVDYRKRDPWGSI
jgi:hypothetical protein